MRKKNKEQIRRLLLLFNIEFINRQYNEISERSNTQDDENFIIKFPFKLFKNENWDVEHIDSQTPDTNDEKGWIETAKEDLSEELADKNNQELTDKINDFLKNATTQVKFTDLHKEICKLSGEVENDEETKNSIGNLTLLNSDINRSYGNALFPTKRRIIIGKDMEGKFIPICTKHVFLKYFDKKGTSRTKWRKDDIQNYQNHIGTILNDFLKVSQKENSNE